MSLAIILWGLLILGLLAANIAGWFYLVSRISRFRCIRNRRTGFLVLLGVNLLLFACMGFMNLLVVVLHLLFVWLAADFIAFCIRKGKSPEPDKPYTTGIVALVCTTLWLTAGWYCAHHVFRTTYDITSPKVDQPLKIVLFSDSHIGTTFHWQTFNRHIDRINAEDADVILIAGDFVDDETTKEDMEKCSEALGRLTAPRGVYLVFGNHDKGYYESRHRGYTFEDLIRNLEAAGVRVLQDETVDLTDTVTIAGRKDRSFTGRKDMKTLMETVAENRYAIVMDHQPNDYAAEASAGSGLVVSGHTHGGQLIPIIHAGEWIGANDRTYGYERRGTTDFIVTSGISDWAIKFKTGCISEYVVIDLHP